MTTHDEQRERRETLLNDARQRGATFSQFAQSEAAEPRGRFTANEKSTVVGSTPIPQYPAAFHQRDPVGQEPALGFSVEDHEPVGTAAEVRASIEKLAKPEDEPPEGETTG